MTNRPAKRIDKSYRDAVPFWRVPGRIAYVVSHSYPYSSNGYAVRTHGVASALVQHGHSVVAINRPGRPWDLPGFKDDGFPLHHDIDGVRYLYLREPSPKGVPQADYQAAAVEALKNTLRVFKPSVVMAASNWENALPASIAARDLGLPFYYEVRGFWEITRVSREPEWRNSSEYKHYVEKETEVAKAANRVFTLNRFMRDELVRRGVDAGKIDLVPNAYSTLPDLSRPPRLTRDDLGIKSRYVVGYVGSFSPYEGLDDLVRACAQLRQRGVDLSLLLVGSSAPSGIQSDPGECGESAKLKKLAQELDFSKHLHLPGRVSPESTADYYAMSDLVVIPRKPLPVCELVQPIKVVEALAYQKSVLVSDVAPLVEFADKHQNVFTFTAGKAESLAAELRGLLGQRITATRVADYTFARSVEPIVANLKSIPQQTKPSASMEKRIFEVKSASPEQYIESGDKALGYVDIFKVEDLVHLANQMAEQLVMPIAAPVPGRVAIVGSHGQSKTGKGYANRTQRVAKTLNESGFESLCIMRPGRPWEMSNGSEPERPKTNEDGTLNIPSLWSGDAGPNRADSYLETTVNIYVKLFREHRPEVVVAAGDFTSALPAIIAAKKLSLPVIKEQLYYGEVFLEEQALSCFSRMNFAEKYAVEQVCLKMADGSFFLYPEDYESWNAFLDTLNRVSGKSRRRKPVATLSPKGIYTIEHGIEDSGLYYLELEVDDETGGNPKGIVASFRFFNAKRKRLKDTLPGFASSKPYPHYQYVNTSKTNGSGRVLVFSVPDNVRKIEADVICFATKGELKLRKAKLGKIRVQDVACWITLAMPGVHWIKAVEAYVHQEGATSLRLALLNYKYTVSKHPNDLSQLNGAIQEMIELDRTWLPGVGYSGKTINIKDTGKLTVAHLHKTAYPYENTGGAIRCLNTVLSQKRMGIDPYIITPSGYPRSAGVTGSKNHEVIEGVEHFRIGANTDGLRGISLPDRTSYSAFHIAKILKSRGASVIHAASGVRGYELALQALALKKITGLPLLYEVRSFHEHTWTPVRNDVMSLEKTELRVIKENFCMAEADFVTTISYSMKKILIERGISPEKIEVIPNAIDETKYLGKEFKPVEIPELKGADFVVGYISNMSRREGHQYLIRAIHQLRMRTGLDIRGLLVGNGPECDNLQKLAAELGLEKIVCFPGEVDHSDINAYYKAIDLFVIPRIPDYAADWVTPLKPYEAMALERPIIVTELPALREIVGDNEERGLVAKPADVDSLVEKLQSYINNPAMRQSKVKTAKEWVFADRTWSANAKRYHLIYRRLVAQAGKGEKEALHA